MHPDAELVADRDGTLQTVRSGLSENQKRDVKSLAHVIGLDGVAAVVARASRGQFVVYFNGQLRDQKRGLRAGPPLPTPGTTLGFMGSKPSCCNFLRASLRARRMASAFSRTSSFGRFFVVAAAFHLPEDPLALHFPFQRLEGLVDIVVTDENLHASFLFNRAVNARGGTRDTHY